MNVGRAKREWFQVQPFSLSGSLKIEVTSKEERGEKKVSMEIFETKGVHISMCFVLCSSQLIEVAV